MKAIQLASIEFQFMRFAIIFTTHTNKSKVDEI